MKRYIRNSISDMSVEERIHLAQRSDDPEILAKLADDEELKVRWAVAGRIDDPELLAKLANDEGWIVRQTVAGRTNDPEILAKLAKDEDEDVRKMVEVRQVRSDNRKQSKSTWANIIEQLGDDYESGMRDPFYEQTEAADYILGLASDVDSSLGYYVEPSVQGGQGGVWIYDENNEVLVDGYDFETFDSEIGEIAFDSKSATDFKKKYKQYLQSLVENG